MWSWWPCHSMSGTLIVSGENPHGLSAATESSSQPSAPGASPSLQRPRLYCTSSSVKAAASIAEKSVGYTLVRSAAVALRSFMRSRSSLARAATGSLRVSRSSSMLSWPVPANQSRSLASNGAIDASVAAATTRSERRAAHATPRGPPPPTAAPRHAPPGEVLDPELIDNCAYVGRAVGDGASGLPGGSAVAGPVVGDQP